MSRIFLMAAIPLLMACDMTRVPNRTEVNFDADSSVMRGIYNGEYNQGTENQSLALQFDATYIDDSSYSIIGKGLLNGNEVGVIGTGKLNDRYAYIRSQGTPVPVATAELKLSDKKTGELRIYCRSFAGLGRLRWACTIEPGSTNLILEKSK